MKTPCFEFSPVAPHSILEDPEWFIWCGTVVETSDGKFSMILARWPKETGFNAWVTDSQLAVAVADEPTGPFRVLGPAWESREGDWDFVAHNPSLLAAEGKYYLYYTGTHAPAGLDGWWDYRNQQRIGVAVADHPAGPWRRHAGPVLEVSPGQWDDLACSNPGCTRGPDGRYYLIYKGIGGDGPMPRGGSVALGIAVADHPEGPFVKHPEPVLSHPTEKWAFEDPFIWSQDGRFYLLAKDFHGFLTDGKRDHPFLVVSDDAIHWRLVSGPALPLAIEHAGGLIESVFRLERPYLLLRDGRPAALYLACLPSIDEQRSFNVHLEIRQFSGV